MTCQATPMAKEANEPLQEEELEVLRKQFEREEPNVCIQTKFNYAWGLVKSDRKVDIQYGIILLSEIYTDAPERRRECLYYLALGHYKLSDYREAKELNYQLLKLEPKNHQAIDLDQLIDQKLSRDGMIGLAIVSGMVAVGAAVVTALLRRGGGRR
ncbi:uncharacterized protein BYT42DRAFT_497595 [Radiomyces spectabilis]|uniref:uncharacterized protein n=1 Tax=Radiomyces spectabilis TaxID=64574 RepID=UPI00221F6A66|nr:uncharacterized protein BYT42DRAFT_497595 [Radiomyces spectabilis]KAI8377629.1 hypothetical protein BYT42DRAFT_497595 [Radiomyces spectabilis]